MEDGHPVPSADPRLLGALRKTVSPAGGVWGGGGVWLGWGVEKWMKRICPRFTPSQIALAEGARDTVSLRGMLSTFFFLKQETVRHSRYKIFYIESVTAHRIKRNDHSRFHNS